MKKNILSNVKPEHYFWFRDGTIIKNLHELYEAISRIDDDIFKHHVSDQRNDFYNWVRDVHQDKKLADNLLKAKTKEDIAEYIKSRVQEIQSIRKTKQRPVKKKIAKKVKTEKKKKLQEIKPEAEKVAKKIEIRKKMKELDNFVFAKFSRLKKKIIKPESEALKKLSQPPKPEIIKDVKQPLDKLYTIPGTIIALATLIGLVASINLFNKPEITGAAITDLQYIQYNLFGIISAIIIIAIVVLVLIIRKKRLK